MEGPYQQSTSCATCDLGSDLLLHDLTSGSVHVLNPTARLIWESCAEGLTFEQITEVVGRRFDCDDPESLVTDVRDTMGLYLQLGLIKQASNGTLAVHGGD
jgi:hypothetical protein